LPVYTFTPSRLDAFAVGLAAALAWHEFPSAVTRLNSFGLAAVASLALYGGCFAGNVDVPGWHLVWLFTGVALWAGAMLLLTLQQGRWQRLLSSPPLLYLGKISYGLYVYHLLAIWGASMVGRRLGFGDAGISCLALLFTVASASLSYRAVEKPFLRYKERFTRVLSRPI
jgi:peptidoglycan/LPS O-acetylase OafA/YrhL